MTNLTIFHTSDMHNKLTADFAARLRELKKAQPGSLMLDSGDAIWAGNVYWRMGGEPILDMMNSVPYDALCVGNREFHFWDMGIGNKTYRAFFPVLSANLRATSDRRTAPLPGFIKLERYGTRIAIIGLTVPAVTEKMLVMHISDYYLEDPIKAAKEIVPQIRAESDIVIALTHIGIKDDRMLAEAVPEIDLILGGHTHLLTEERVGNTAIIHHGFYVHFVGRVDIEFDSGRITSIKNEVIPFAKA